MIEKSIHERRQPRRTDPRIPWIGEDPGLLRRGEARCRDAARLRHLSRLPALLQSLRSLSAPVRSGRRLAQRRSWTRRQRRFQAGRRRLHALRHVLHDEVPVRAAACVQSRLPASDAALPRRRGAERARSNCRPASSPRPTATASWRLRGAARQLGDRPRQQDLRGR